MHSYIIARLFKGKIQKGKQRLELMNDKSQHAAMMTSQIRLLSDKIAKLEAETEEAGIRGDVEQAQGLMKMCDQLKDERDQLQKQSENRYINQFFLIYAFYFMITHDLFCPIVVIQQLQLN